MIKVLSVISDTNIGGAGRVLINYLKYYDRENFSMVVALPKGSMLKERLAKFNIPIYEIDGMADKSMDFGAIKELKKVIKAENPDIVHTHGSMSGRIAGRQCGKVVIYTRHSAFPVSNRIKKGPGRFINKKINEHYADRIIAISPAAAENLTEGGISPDIIDIMMNGVEPVKRLPDEEVWDLKEDFGIGPENFTVGIIARIEDYKGHMDILQAVKNIVDTGRKIKLIIAGSGSYEREVKDRIKELGLENNVVFMGFVSDVASILSIIDLQLNASWGTETSSLSILEGFSMGIPAVVSDYGGNPCLVEDGVNGLIFKRRDPDDLTRCILKIMDSEELLDEMGKKALEVYKAKFTGEIFASNIEKIYVKTLKGVKNG